MSALNIKDREVAEKARRLARLKKTSITEAVSQALDESLRAAAPKAAAAEDVRKRRVDAIVKRFRAQLKRGAPSPHKVLEGLYDSRGLPK
jgi:hypothetical protein